MTEERLTPRSVSASGMEQHNLVPEVAASGAMVPIIETLIKLGQRLTKSITFSVDEANLGPEWQQVALAEAGDTPDNQPPPPLGPVSLIGAQQIDPRTNAVSFVVTGVRFNVGEQEPMDISGHDIADVYVSAASGNRDALAAVRALSARNEDAFRKHLNDLKNTDSHNEVTRAARTQTMSK